MPSVYTSSSRRAAPLKIVSTLTAMLACLLNSSTGSSFGGARLHPGRMPRARLVVSRFAFRVFCPTKTNTSELFSYSHFQSVNSTQSARKQPVSQFGRSPRRHFDLFDFRAERLKI